MSSSPRVVFLANDAVFKQGLAFLESFREHNPGLALSMIPFADDIERFKSVQDIYNFDIIETDLHRWDDLSNRLYPGVEKKYMQRLRKLAVFDALAPVTIYVDIDTVVLKDLSFVAKPIEAGLTDLICMAPGNDPWVYNDNYKQYGKLLCSKRFSDGFFAFNPAKLSADLALDVIVSNETIYRDVRAERVYTQPATNFVVDMLMLRVSILYEVFPHISPRVWYADEEILLKGDAGVETREGKEVLFVHWAGPIDINQTYRLKEIFETYFNRARMRLLRCGKRAFL